MSKKLTASYRGHFADSMSFDVKTRTAVSVRDGILEYLGSEIGMEPGDRTFLIYRSPATIANAARAMEGIPVTDEHVTLDMPPPTEGGRVTESIMADADANNTQTTLVVLNAVEVRDTLEMAIEAGKRELSLGYTADLVPHDEYDFEQRDIRPHHVAVVDRGRCGPMCSFIDKLPEVTMKLHKAFCDAEGAMNLQQIVELATALPEAIKAVPVDQLTKLLPALKQIVEAAKAVAPEAAEEPVEEPAKDAEPVPAPAKDEEPDPEPKEEDKKGFSDAVAQAIRVQLADAVRERLAIIEKARGFLPEDYAFADKGPEDIMRDALATDSTAQFKDSELPIAFKLLKKRESKYEKFADQQPAGLASLKDKEL